jgi:hypothetical protein
MKKYLLTIWRCCVMIAMNFTLAKMIDKENKWIYILKDIEQ